MPEHHIEKVILDTIQSFDGAGRAVPKPFLLTRLMASINNRAVVKNGWTRLGIFISRPGIAFAGLLFIALLNVAIFVSSKNHVEGPDTVQNDSALKDEFAINAVSIYDIENLEQQ